MHRTVRRPGLKRDRWYSLRWPPQVRAQRTLGCMFASELKLPSVRKVIGQQRRLSRRQTFQPILERVIEMPRNIYVAAYILVLIAVVVGVDILFFRHRFWERLMANIGIVLVFGAFYLRFLKNS